MKFRFTKGRQGNINTFGKIIPLIIKDLKLEESFISERIRMSWVKIVGEMIATHSLPDRIFKKILFIYVDHSIYSNEIILMKDYIVTSINDEIGFEVINNIRIDIKKLVWNNMNKSNTLAF